ncbi:hypothetical protein HD806DRAFT_511882 [Xylariaceae sp. AK1471]|nr:hypothetical protein HD806DRAFT_511882 [Xylariaceae sp. AK1471]
MAEHPQTLQERLNNLITVVDRLEEGFSSEFADWESKNLPSAEDYFEWTYSEIIRTLRRITDEKFKDNADPTLKSSFDALFARAVGLLSRSVEHVRKVNVSLGPLHKRLLADMFRLAETQYCSGLNGLSMHLISMGNQLRQIWPPAREAWEEDGTDLKPDEEFERVYEAFENLENTGQYDLYSRDSWLQLKAACRALHIPEREALPGQDFFHNETRPTYVDYSCTSKEFLYGIGGRPGILSIKRRLGGPLTVEEEEKIKEAAQKRGKKRRARNRARKEVGGSKRARTQLGYTMTRVNAAADVEDILRDSKYPDMATPTAERLVTPTCKNHEHILKAYGKDLRGIVNAIYKVKFNLPTSTAKLPQTPAERNTWLKRATTDINSTRAMVNMYIGSTNSPAKAKKLRLAAYRLKLTRAIYMLGLLSGEPSASPAEIKNGLQARLDDWILHEQAWNAADRFQISRRLKQETLNALQANIQERDNNINRWRRMRDDLDNQPPPENTNVPDNGVEEVPREEEDDDDENGEEEEGLPWLTDEEIRNATSLLDGVLVPRKPKASGSFPAYKEVTDPFAAGGPPDHDQLPLGSVWGRLQHMWVMTHWRFYQLRNLELEDEAVEDGDV